TVELEGFTRPHGIRWLADNRHVWVTAEFETSLLKVDVETGRIVLRVDTGQDGSHMLALSPDGKRLYTANRGSDSVSVFDAWTGRKLRDLPAGPGAEGIDVSADGKEIWTGFRRSNEAGVIDLASGSLVAKLPTGRAPFRTRLTPDGRYALVSNLESSDLSVFDVAARKLVKTEPLPLLTLGPFEKPDPLGSFRAAFWSSPVAGESTSPTPERAKSRSSISIGWSASGFWWWVTGPTASPIPGFDRGLHCGEERTDHGLTVSPRNFQRGA
ncbi:MAG: YncE family protein, partial [Vicinamibacteria bacterium]